MINIVHPLFRRGRPSRNSALGTGIAVALLLPAPGLAALPSFPGGAPGMAPMPFTPAAEARYRGPPCDPEVDCSGRRPPGPPDRDVRPFEGTLGRPCAYRWRFSPQGTRRVRVCF